MVPASFDHFHGLTVMTLQVRSMPPPIPPDSAPERVYRVYTFEAARQNGAGKSVLRWQRQDATADRDHAITQAVAFFQSGRYARVEVRQTEFDPIRRDMTDKTVKILARAAHGGLGPFLLPLGLCALCVIAAGILTAVLLMLRG